MTVFVCIWVSHVNRLYIDRDTLCATCFQSFTPISSWAKLVGLQIDAFSNLAAELLLISYLKIPLSCAHVQASHCEISRAQIKSPVNISILFLNDKLAQVDKLMDFSARVMR